jgi:hypothetical protein
MYDEQFWRDPTDPEADAVACLLLLLLLLLLLCISCRMPWLALKILPSGYVGTSPWSTKDGEGRAKSLSIGMYAFYQEKEALSVGILDPNVPGRSTFTSVRDCLQVNTLLSVRLHFGLLDSS